ncbi:hypothetical protein Kpol_1028p22 [Vanderwaltozyma polyspora DSM 70294]|uniref:Monopolin complex subunit CSM1 n=1 Tax=Vanderwaltozyma polyspora (strain ATCC 22028 / DSM 70294 / BCRC 21397 / CBS 2163 / NBRC 10782 / NRRL Y-8283 / UCD 57-17) TaxID=436907 RepID=A7TFZ2_VANPO|nr:uncharacterized protein Kpol_1028p22 [Vanderwaltozyma polyspora DSM 70294]EDO18749.1 hypothetical protein Kpol_1028p22 [Vanderwaltozyma polyspora DSM 70294]
MSDSFIQYKKSIKERLDNADLLVSKVIHENTLLSQQLDSRNEEISYMKEKLDKHKTKVDSLNDKITKQNENLEIFKDLFEHLCGVRVHKSYEDDTGLWFDVSQGSDSGVMDYKLGFVKGESSQSNENDENIDENEEDKVNDNSGSGTQVIYVPLLKQRTSSELKVLQNQLPSYMFDTLSFPLKSLNQFYAKLARSLNKK